MSLSGVKRARKIGGFKPPPSIANTIQNREIAEKIEADAFCEGLVADNDSESSDDDASSRDQDASPHPPPSPIPSPFGALPERAEFQFNTLPPAPDAISFFPDVDFKTRRAYQWLASGVVGASAYFCHVFPHIKVCKNMVWIFDAETSLWTTLTDNQLMDRAGGYVRTAYCDLKPFVSDAVQFLEEREEKDLVKPWKAASARLTRCMDTLSSYRGLKELLEQLKVDMEDDAFDAKLDANPHVISCLNGVLDLRTLTLRPRVEEDFLTFALSYNWNPSADTTAMNEFVMSLFESDEDANAVQCTVGYWLTGLTTIKKFWQIAAPTQSGKTTFFTVLKSAFEDYASMGEVPIEELTTSKFEDGLVRALDKRPRIRLLIFDEIGDKISFKEDVLNQLTSGKASAKLSLREKQKKPRVASNFYCKLAFLTNHELNLPASATGLVRRNTGWGLKLRFLGDGEVLGECDRRANSSFEDAVLSDVAIKQGVLKWIAQGAKRFLDEKDACIECPRFVDASFQLHIKGDLYLEWITEVYFPTGSSDDKEPLDALVRDFRATKRGAKSDDAAFEGIKAALESMSSYIYPVKYQEYGVLIQGYSGLRKRLFLDADWCSAIDAAKKARNPDYLH